MKIVVAPHGFKGSFDAPSVSRAIADGLRRVFPFARVVTIPMADGGEGTVRALVAATGGRMLSSVVSGPLGERVNAEWGVLGDGVTAVIEMAAASGITLMPPEKLDPMQATTFGTGELMQAALDSGCREFIIGIGGSATNDGGAGMAQALGGRLLDGSGRELRPGGAALCSLERIDVSCLDKRLSGCHFVVACDVSNPLCGAHGASHVFGPQKAATPQQCRALDDALANYARVLKSDLGVDVLAVPGGGAAGGMGAGAIAFLGATLRPGVEIVLEAVRFRERLAGAVLVFTGEGRLDGTTLSGKTVAGVARVAREQGIPVIAITGQLAVSADELMACGLEVAVPIAAGPMTLPALVASSVSLIADAAERAARLVRVGILMPRNAA